MWLLAVCASCEDASEISLENETNGIQPMLGNRCVVGTTVAQMPLTNWGLSGIAAKRKQHLRSLSSRQGVVGGVLPETGVVSSGFTGYGARVGNLMNCKSDLHDESGLN